MHSNIRIVARRGDGLGQRLYAILNAIYLSHLTGLEWGFVWSERFVGDPDHAISPASDFFDEVFIERHMVPNSFGQNFVYPSGQLFDREALLAPIRDGRINGWIAGNVHLSNILVSDSLPNSEFSLKTAMSLIGFSERIRKCIAFAESVNIPDNTTAIHMRAGDVVYGYYRKWGRFVKKCIPVPLSRKLARDLIEGGQHVAIFGQSKAALEESGSNQAIIDIASICDGHFYDNDEKAIIDIILMSRCARIVAGNSGFPIQASRVGGIPLVGIQEFFKPAAAVNIIEADLVGGVAYPSLEMALCYWYMWCVARKYVAPERACGWLESAAKLDPENPIYPYSLANFYFDRKNYDEGDKALARSIDIEVQDASADPKLWDLVASGHFDGDLKRVTKAADFALPHAMFLRALFMEKASDYTAACEDILYALAISPGHPAFTVALQRILRKRAVSLARK